MNKKLYIKYRDRIIEACYSRELTSLKKSLINNEDLTKYYKKWEKE